MKIILLFFISNVFANPYFDETEVLKDAPHFRSKLNVNHSGRNITKNDPSYGLPSLRITLNWNSENETYMISQKIIENSGTESLHLRAKNKAPWGSYKGTLKDSVTGDVFYDSIGTGREYRKLTRAITLRFPVPKNDFKFELIAENPTSGEMEKVFSEEIELNKLNHDNTVIEELETRVLKKAQLNPSPIIAIYA